ncbi:molybdenum cofactor biosynthesis protein MoaE [Sphingomonas crusticola]|uniref:molybdenum cofactor biosynthesis protein MoaE n=1 Tax=Sphingomonas crusticola TaxID=1697973 RepID=UPI001967A310|nr:molybdenum cofactor biosynthesis protein MoaE [Sphingomonas crusticola]
MIEVRLQAEMFEGGVELARLQALGGGALASFTGVVRGDGDLRELFLEHHAVMTLAMMRGLADEAAARWKLIGVTLIHRYGALSPGDPIVFVATAAKHRAAALEACASLIDRLKTEAPFWKRETFHDGHVQWVEPRSGDDAAAARWLRDES